MYEATTFDARVYRTEVYKGRRVTTYWVRWKVGARPWKEPFRTVAQADSAPERSEHSVNVISKTSVCGRARQLTGGNPRLRS